MNIYAALKEISNMSDVELKEKLIEVLNLMISEKVNLIEGVRMVVWLASALEILNNEEFLVFRGFEDETDKFPVGEVREKWNKDALALLDIEAEEYINESKLEIIAESNNLLSNIFSQKKKIKIRL